MGHLFLQLRLPSAVLGQLLRAVAAAPASAGHQALQRGASEPQHREAAGLLCRVPAAPASKEALLLPSHTGPHQSPSYAVLFPICVTAGKWHTIPTASWVLPTPRKDTIHEFSWVAATFGLPEWCAEQQEPETKSIPLSFVLGILLVSEKGPEISRHYFVSEL